VLKIDLHLHTAEDPWDDIRHTAADLVDRAAAFRFDALAITLHDRQLTDPSLVSYARDRGIVLLPGIERTVDGRHVLLIGFDACEAESVGSFDDLARLKARGGGLIIAPHPFYPGFSCLRSLMDRRAKLFDAVEWSYFWTRGANFNTAAARWAAAHGKPLVGNSDLHDLRQLGRTYSEVDCGDRDPAAICDAIRAGRVTVRSSPVSPIELAQVCGGMTWRTISGVARSAPASRRDPAVEPAD
jgi:predicted metal-dependent phosphoesterase TrpH